MRLVVRLLSVLLVLLAVLAAVLVYRTLTYVSPAADHSSAVLQPAPEMDVNKAAENLGQAIRFRTITEQDSASVDRAEWDAMHEWLARTYPLTHARLTLDKLAGHTLLYTWQGSDTSLEPFILMAHQDVVPVAAETESQWTHPPFSGAVADGAVWGRGTVDDKGSMIALLESTEALLQSGFQPKRTVILLFGHDEEGPHTGASAAAKWLAEKGVKAEFVLDEGLLTITDFPLTKDKVAMIGIAEKGYATVRLTAKADGGHSSMPPRETAVATLSRALVAITDNQAPMDIKGPGADTLRVIAPDAPFMVRMAIANEWLFKPLLISQMAATPAGAALLHTTTAPTMLAGSPKENVLPDTATAIINHRIIPGETSGDVVARSVAAIGKLPVTVELSGEPQEPSPVSSTTSDAWKILAALASQDGTLPVTPGLVLAATDSYQLGAIGRDTYRFQPIQLSLDDTAMVHGVNEHMTLENLKRLTDFYAGLIATAGSR